MIGNKRLCEFRLRHIAALIEEQHPLNHNGSISILLRVFSRLQKPYIH
jgi:hypothetical protein